MPTCSLLAARDSAPWNVEKVDDEALAWRKRKLKLQRTASAAVPRSA
jgi:hypothetical protein